MTSIARVHGRQILDSRGNPTVEVEVQLESGAFGARGRALGRVDRRARGGRAARRWPSWGGKGVPQAVANVARDRSGEVAGLDARDQAALDRELIELDGTPNKGRLGANAILGVSLAVAKAAAAETRAAALPLPRRRATPRRCPCR